MSVTFRQKGQDREKEKYQHGYEQMGRIDIRCEVVRAEENGKDTFQRTL